MSLAGDAARLAVGTLTVLPVRPPLAVHRSTAALAMAIAPVAVLPLAAAVAAVVWLGGALLAPPLLTAVLGVAVLALGSAGLHLDGLADSADGLAVPGDRARRLEVMRTGDVGPAGAVTLLLVLLVQSSALAGIITDRSAAAAAVTAGLAVVVSRAALAPACLRGIPAARADGLGSAVAGSVPAPAALAVLVVVTAVAGLVQGGRGVAGVALAVLVVGAFLLRARRRLGGVSGDVLGACVELALAGYLVAQAVSPPGAWLG